MDYPNDADGDSLRRVAEGGSDMAQPMSIDFSVAAPDERSARRIAELVCGHGFDPSISDDERTTSWHIYCSKVMLATYDGVVAAKDQLTAIAAPHGGSCDGWETFGNNTASVDD